MLTKVEKSRLRGRIFRHLDGIAMTSVAHIFHKNNITEKLIEHKRVNIDEFATQLGANSGYLNVAMRMLCSQGWLDYTIEGDQINYSCNERSELAFSYFSYYESAFELLQISQEYNAKNFDSTLISRLKKAISDYHEKCKKLSSDPLKKEIEQQVISHLEGIIIGPSVVHLGMGGMFHKYFMETSFRPEEFHRQPESFTVLLDFFTDLAWFIKKNGTYQFTDKGMFFARRASAYGVTVSYIPTFNMMQELLLGDGNILKINQIDGPEKHVDRKMNVWGSGGAHSAYFKIIDKVIIDLFNKPIEQQPKGVLDMGCGNGAFLEHIFNIIERQTIRGEMLEEYPLFLVGADFNEAALNVTRANLINADIWAKVMFGDIGNPDKLANDLREMYQIELSDLLSVRSFLDHNRVWSAPKDIDTNFKSGSTGAFVTRGKRLSNAIVEQNLVEHFMKWSPHVSKFGLLVIELHTIDPKLTANNIGKTAATAYDATHGFSDQYILEIDSFLKAAEKAQLYHHPNSFAKFPKNDLATVSISLLKGNPSKS